MVCLYIIDTPDDPPVEIAAAMWIIMLISWILSSFLLYVFIIENANALLLAQSGDKNRSVPKWYKILWICILIANIFLEIALSLVSMSFIYYHILDVISIVTILVLIINLTKFRRYLAIRDDMNENIILKLNRARIRTDILLYFLVFGCIGALYFEIHLIVIESNNKNKNTKSWPNNGPIENSMFYFLGYFISTIWSLIIQIVWLHTSINCEKFCIAKLCMSVPNTRKNSESEMKISRNKEKEKAINVNKCENENGGQRLSGSKLIEQIKNGLRHSAGNSNQNKPIAVRQKSPATSMDEKDFQMEMAGFDSRGLECDTDGNETSTMEKSKNKKENENENKNNSSKENLNNARESATISQNRMEEAEKILERDDEDEDDDDDDDSVSSISNTFDDLVDELIHEMASENTLQMDPSIDPDQDEDLSEGGLHEIETSRNDSDNGDEKESPDINNNNNTNKNNNVNKLDMKILSPVKIDVDKHGTLMLESYNAYQLSPVTATSKSNQLNMSMNASSYVSFTNDPDNDDQEYTNTHDTDGKIETIDEEGSQTLTWTHSVNKIDDNKRDIEMLLNPVQVSNDMRLVNRVSNLNKLTYDGRIKGNRNRGKIQKVDKRNFSFAKSNESKFEKVSTSAKLRVCISPCVYI